MQIQLCTSHTQRSIKLEKNQGMHFFSNHPKNTCMYLPSNHPNKSPNYDRIVTKKSSNYRKKFSKITFQTVNKPVRRHFTLWCTWPRDHPPLFQNLAIHPNLNAAFHAFISIIFGVTGRNSFSSSSCHVVFILSIIRLRSFFEEICESRLLFTVSRPFAIFKSYRCRLYNRCF